MTESIASLNIGISANLDGLRKDLKVAERALKSTAAELSNIGKNMSMAISLPLLGIGAATVKAAGEFEALRLSMRATFEGAGRSMSAADAELENLRKSALAPGLDLEQAVKGSIRLQNVGFSAENARKVIEELANTIATTGGTAEDLDEVTRQFTQMIGKGKILQEDLKILEGRMPILSRLMKQTWGTTTAAGLRDAGVSASQFVEVMTKEMSKLPRVAGGISNSIVNATSAVRQFAVGIGDMLNQNLGIQKMLDGFGTWVGKLTERIKELSPETKAFLVDLAKWAVIIPPVIFGLAGLVKAQAALRVATLTVSTGIADMAKTFSGMMAWLGRLRAAFLSLSLATQAFAGVAIALAVYSAIQAFNSYNKTLSATEKAQIAVADVQQRAVNSTVSERLEAERLVKTITDQNASRQQQQQALSKLQSISKEYFGGLTLEKSTTEDYTTALGKYSQALIGVAVAKKAADRVAELTMRLEDAKNMAEEAAPTMGQTFVNAVKSMGTPMGFAIYQGKTFAENTKNLTAELTAEKAVMEALVQKNEHFAAAMDSGANSANKFGKSANKFGKEVKELTDLEKERQKIELEGSKSFFKDFSLDAEKIKNLKKLEQSTKFYTDAIEELGVATSDVGALPMGSNPAQDHLSPNVLSAPTVPGIIADPTIGENIDSWTDAMKRFQETWDFSMKSVEKSGNVMQTMIVDFAGTFQDLENVFVDTFKSTMESASAAYETAKEKYAEAQAGTAAQAEALKEMAQASKDYAGAFSASMKAVAKSALDAAASVIAAYIRSGVAAAIGNALKNPAGVIPPVGLALAAAAGAGASALFRGMLAKITAPKLAKGGLAYGPTMAMVGDNPNARANPEVIAPLNKLKSIIGDAGGGGFMVSHRIEGNDLLLLVERANNKRTRARGF